MNVHAAHKNLGKKSSPQSYAPKLERSRGRAELTFKSRAKETVLDHLHQEGCCKIRFPKEAPIAQAILINTSGGLTDHDEMDMRVKWNEDTSAIVTSQAAEKIYKSRGAPCHILNHLEVKEGATGIWIPQETILFDKGQASRTLTAHIAESGRLLAHESVCFGRTAMGETVETGAMIDKWRLYYGDKLLFADTLSLKGDLQEQLNAPALFDGSVAIASFVYIGEDAEDIKSIISPIADEVTSFCGISVQGPLMVMRLMAKDAQILRGDIIRIISSLLRCLADTSDKMKHDMLPRVWSC